MTRPDIDAIDRAAERIERAIRETGERMALTIAAAIVAQSESGEGRTANRGLFGTSWANDAWNATAPKDSGDTTGAARKESNLFRPL